MRLVKALTRLRVCAHWSEPLLIKNTSLLEAQLSDQYLLDLSNVIIIIVIIIIIIVIIIIIIIII